MKKLRILISSLLVVAMILSFALIGVACQNKEDEVDSPLYYNPETTFGLYFVGPNHGIGPENEDMIRSSANMDTTYFDPSKPTVIWVHGWEPTYSTTDRDMSTSGDAQSKAGIKDLVSYAQEYRTLGYNVATFQYQIPVIKDSAAGSLPQISYYTFVDVQDMGYSMGFLMASELCMNLGENYNQEISYIGHSCGSFVSLAINYYIKNFLDNRYIKNSHLLASRISLVDPYFNSIGTDMVTKKTIYLTNEAVGTRSKAKLCMDIIKSLVEEKDVAVDVYLGMTSMASNSFYRGSAENTQEYFDSVAACCAIVDMAGLRAKYGDFNIHVLTRDWVFMSKLANKMVDENGDLAPSLALTTAEIKALRGKQYTQNNNSLKMEGEGLTTIDTVYVPVA